MRSSFRSLFVATLVALAALIPFKSVQADPLAIDPTASVSTAGGSFNAVGNVNDIYYNRNQLLLRITGCEYAARVTTLTFGANQWNDGYCDDGAGSPRHWTGSGMAFIESIVNDKLLGAVTDVALVCDTIDPSGTCGGTAGVTVPAQYFTQYGVRTWGTRSANEPIFRNYVDLLVKRLLDGDLNTPLDYDTYTFRYVDSYNPSFTTPTYLGQTINATTTDTNGDGVEGGWEGDLGSLIAPFCLPDLIVIGPEVCFNINVVNIQDTLPFFPQSGVWGTNTTTPTPFAVTEINNVGAPMLDFQRYLTANQAGTSHLFLASQPKREFTFDSEIENCVSSLIADGTDCNDSAYRDDDDGLFVEIKLVDFEIDLLFEPPFTDSAYGVSTEVWSATPGNPRGPGVRARHSVTDNVWDIPATDNDNTNQFGAGNEKTSWPCPGRANDDVSAVANVTSEESSTYVAACDLSRWIKMKATARIPELTIGLSVRIEVSYDSGPQFATNMPVVLPDIAPANVTGPRVTLGLDLEFITFEAELAVVPEAGNFCNTDYGSTGNTEAVQGQDYLGVFYDQTDVPRNCEPRILQPGSPSPFDDAAYQASSQFVTTFSFVRAQVLGQFEDFFNPTTNPGFFLAPTVIPGLGDLNDIVGEINFPWPLAASSETDAVWIQLGLQGDVELYDDMLSPIGGTEYVTHRMGSGAQLEDNGLDGDSTNEFWADPWGVVVPLSGGIGFYWTQDTLATNESVSCVTADAGYTGYVDGYQSTGAGNSGADDPAVSRTIPNLALNWSGSADIAGAGGEWQSASKVAGSETDDGPEYDSMLLHLRIPNVSGLAPFVTAETLKLNGSAAADRTVPTHDGSTTGDETYAIGIAIHQNFLSKVIYEFVIDGLLCIDINPDAAEEDALDGLLGGLLTTDTLGLFVPFLSDHFAGQNMSLRIVPLLKDPSGKFLQNDRGNYSSAISNFVRNFQNGSPADATSSNPIPRIIMGGINQEDLLKKRFRGQIATEALVEYTCGVTDANPLTDPTCGIWPDFSIVIPHLMMEFFVNEDQGGTIVRHRAFALDVGVNVGLNIDVIQNPVGPVVQDPSTSGLFGDAIPNSRPVYGGTNFPVGCDYSGNVNPNFPCDIVDVPSRLVIFLGGLLDPELNAVLVYDELPASVTDFTGVTEATNTCVDPTDSSTSCARGNSVSVIDSYEDAISNLLGLILSGEISFFAEIGFDPAAYLDLPIIVTIPYIGPSYVVNDDSESGQTAGKGIPDGVASGALYDGLGCLRDFGDDHCPDPVFGNSVTGASSIVRDISDGDANGFGDYLVVALGIDISYLETRFLLRLIDTFVEPLLNDYCDGEDSDGNAITDVTCTSESFDSRLTDVLGSLGLAPGFAPESDGRFPVGYQSPETIIKGVRKAHGFETVIEYEGWHPSVDASDLTFSYRVDGGFWTPFVPATTARIPGLFEGRHVFEVRAMDPSKNVEYTPERIEFVVDSVAPRIAVLGDRVQSGSAEYVIDVYDAQTLPEDVRIAYKLGEGEWSGYSYDKQIVLDAAKGQHVLRVRAMDESGNVGEQVLTIAVEDGGFGCASTTAGGDGLIDLLLILLVPALIIRTRRRAA